MNTYELDTRRMRVIKILMQIKDADLLDLVYKILVLSLEEK